jgi:prephenate dehydrogenase
MANVSVGILGLGRIGASMALALKHYNTRKDAAHQFTVTAADLRPGIREDAEKVGVERPGRDLFAATREQDIVVLALPYADLQAAYREIGRDLRPGTVVLDAAPLKGPSLAWAGEHLHEGTHLVGIAPILNPAYLFDGADDTLHAAPDLFEKGTMLLMPGRTAAPDAVQLASDFAVLLGATPHFAEPAEFDGMTAATEGLPALLGLAAFYTLMKSPGWVDIGRVTNPGFGRLTHHLMDTHPDDLRDILYQNRAAVALQLDALLGTLSGLRTALKSGDKAALEAALVDSAQGYETWLGKRQSGKWDETEKASPLPEGGMMGNLFGGWVGKRLGGKSGKS